MWIRPDFCPFQSPVDNLPASFSSVTKRCGNCRRTRGQRCNFACSSGLKKPNFGTLGRHWRRWYGLNSMLKLRLKSNLSKGIISQSYLFLTAREHFFSCFWGISWSCGTFCCFLFNTWIKHKLAVIHFLKSIFLFKAQLTIFGLIWRSLWETDFKQWGWPYFRRRQRSRF